MIPEEVECDSCGNIRLEMPYDRRRAYQFTLEQGDNTYETRQYQLCNECIRRIVDWVDDTDESETRIEAVSVDRLADGLAEEAQDLAALADRLQQLSASEE